MIERQGEPRAGALPDRLAHPVDRRDKPGMVGLATHPERARQIGWADREEIDALDRGDLVDPLDRLDILDHAGQQDLAV